MHVSQRGTARHSEAQRGTARYSEGGHQNTWICWEIVTISMRYLVGACDNQRILYKMKTKVMNVNYTAFNVQDAEIYVGRCV